MAQKTVEIRKEAIGEDIYHYVKGLPQFQELTADVKEIIQRSSYWERHGRDLSEIGAAVILHLIGLYLCSSDSLMPFACGFLLLGLCHSVIANRASHLAIHNALFDSRALNQLTCWLTAEVHGFFSLKAATDIHIKIHHPYTNIIGLGDSSSWKAPMLPRYPYLYFAPMAIPIITPLVSLKELRGRLWTTASYLLSIALGFTFNVWLIMKISGFESVWTAACFMFAFRAITAPSYIHINIFQHIGLPMFSLKNRPSKLYQMSVGVLNLHRVAIFDWIMGHTLFYCHIEHHLFPTLSDSMCLKVRPLVRRFMEEHGLPYTEKHYGERLAFFTDRYDELMVKAPPFTHFVGLQ